MHDLNQSVDSLCGTAALQCETVAASLGETVKDLSGGVKRQVVTIQALACISRARHGAEQGCTWNVPPSGHNLACFGPS